MKKLQKLLAILTGFVLVLSFSISCTAEAEPAGEETVVEEAEEEATEPGADSTEEEPGADDKIIKALAYAVALDLWKDSSRQHYGFEPKYEFETEEEWGQAIDEAINDAIDAGQDVELREAWQAYSELMQLYTEETQGMSEGEQIAYWEEHQAEYIPLYATVEFCLSEGILSALK